MFGSRTKNWIQCSVSQIFSEPNVQMVDNKLSPMFVLANIFFSLLVREIKLKSKFEGEGTASGKNEKYF